MPSIKNKWPLKQKRLGNTDLHTLLLHRHLSTSGHDHLHHVRPDNASTLDPSVDRRNFRFGIVTWLRQTSAGREEAHSSHVGRRRCSLQRRMVPVFHVPCRSTLQRRFEKPRPPGRARLPAAVRLQQQLRQPHNLLFPQRQFPAALLPVVLRMLFKMAPTVQRQQRKRRGRKNQRGRYDVIDTSQHRRPIPKHGIMTIGENQENPRSFWSRDCQDMNSK